ncbi:nicotinate-nucleotide--dimethylbenzimidazole phosphoribosyltransferase, partial [Kineococcus glutinatus]|uniref:nicotinate-nucleotide--dimethylbenzimidazole phosphoribosyltransferase n=1 Tax=Kineococcus glutinatus TaxID=1070872 RepID=UPI0031E8A2EB
MSERRPTTGEPVPASGAGPAAPARLELADLATAVALPDREAAAAAQERLAAMAAGGGPLGRLRGLATWLAGVRGERVGEPLDRVRLVVLAADSAFGRAGLDRWAPGWTAERVRALREGSAPAAVLAGDAGVGVHVADVGVGSAHPAAGQGVRRAARRLPPRRA